MEYHKLGAAINGIARKTLTITMFFIGASLSIDVLKAVGIKPLVQGILLWVNNQLEHIGIHLFLYKEEKKRELYKREKGGRMIVVNDFLPPLFIQF